MEDLRITAEEIISKGIKIKKSYFISAVLAITLAITAAVLIVEPAYQVVKKTEYVEAIIHNNMEFLTPQIHPEIKILTNYQKSRNSKIPVELAKIQAELIVNIVSKHQLPIELLVAMMEQESTFNPFSESQIGAAGLGQIYQGDEDIDQKKKYDIGYNINESCKILKEKLQKNKGVLSKALQDYSGNAKMYSEKVYINLARYVLFRSTMQSDDVALKETVKEINEM